MGRRKAAAVALATAVSWLATWGLGGCGSDQPGGSNETGNATTNGGGGGTQSGDGGGDGGGDIGGSDGGSLPIDTSGRIQPESDLVYLGAFRLPDVSDNGTNWGYSTHGMSYRPDGDPNGPADATPGSLFAISHPWHNLAAEISIPEPVISASKNLSELPVTTMLQSFIDVTEGRQTGGLEGTTLGDIQYFPSQPGQTTDKLYWVMYVYYLPPHEGVGFGWSEPDWGNLQSAGTWRLSDFNFSATSKYLFEIPKDWADQHTPGKELAAGRFRVVNGGSIGPALHAYGPYNDNAGNPPSDGASLDAARLLYYPRLDKKLEGFSSGDNWDDGVWLTVGDKSAVVFTGPKAMRTWESGQQFYGNPTPDQCGDHGYHAAPYVGSMLFYDPADLAKVAAGEIESWTPQPYAVFNVDDLMFNRACDSARLGGAAFDRERGLLYVAEKEVDGQFNPRPLIHVWKLTDDPRLADTQAPTTPAELTTSSNVHDAVTLSWQPSTDDVHLVGYIVYREGEPIGTALTNSYTDDKVNPEGLYHYTVEAWDAVSQRSAPTAVLAVETPDGADNRMPLIHNVEVSDITATTATISWTTDEAATTELNYGVQYSGNTFDIVDPTPIRNHTVALTGLVPNKNYEYYITATDADNHTNLYHREFFNTP